MAGTRKPKKEAVVARDESIGTNTRLYEVVKTKLNRDPDLIRELLEKWYHSYEWLDSVSEEEKPKAKRYLAEVVVEMIEEGKL